MIDIYIVYDNRNVEDIVWSIPTDSQPFFHFLDTTSKKDKSKAFKLKQEWGAKKNPFCLIEKDGKIVKAFYTETGDNAISQLIEYLRND
jgi:glutathione peroxidase-family protein